MLSDIEIAQAAAPDPIEQVAERVGLSRDEVEPYGRYKAKIRLEALTRLRGRPDGKLILITGMTPTPAGEGKTTTTVGLTDALCRLGQRAMLAIREPSMGPCFGVKGGAAGGGYAQVIPMDEINLHFTGDIHAVGAAHNLLAAMLDNHLHWDNVLGVDPRRVIWKRVIDMNDRSLRHVALGLGGAAHGVPRESGFEITAASEVMAALCLATDLGDLRDRLDRMIVAETSEGRFVRSGDLKAGGAMTVLLRDALKPNLVQTVEKAPAFVHGGPFGNIAHGCNSLVATRLALKLADCVVTEAGFATDLGA
ncbi:MAG: formate--tetrahydrofolate ligase, partial [Candidatus Tectimicrobiota bacterium]